MSDLQTYRLLKPIGFTQSQFDDWKAGKIVSYSSPYKPNSSPIYASGPGIELRVDASGAQTKIEVGDEVRLHPSDAKLLIDSGFIEAA